MCPASSDPTTTSKDASASARDRVVHNYVDRSLEADPTPAANGTGNTEASMDHNFPVKLHYMLTNMEQDNQAHIISWQPHGRCFMVHDMKEFVASMLPLWFRQSKMASFQRQLNLYGFQRITQGRDKNAYYHEYFLRGRPQLAQKITRTKVKGKGARKASSPETEPRFYELPWMKETQSQAQTVSPPSDITPSPPATASDPSLTASVAVANPVFLAAAASAPTSSLGEAMGLLNYSQALSTAHFLASGSVHPLLPNQGQQWDGNSAVLNSLLTSLGGGAAVNHTHAHHTTTSGNRNYIPIAPAPQLKDYASFNGLRSTNGVDTSSYGTVLEALKAQCAASTNTGASSHNHHPGAFTRPGPTPF